MSNQIILYNERSLFMRYVANDGKVCDREEDCTAYEQSLDVKETARKLSPQEALDEIRREEIKRLEKRAIGAQIRSDEALKKFQSELSKYVKDTDDYEFGAHVLDDFMSRACGEETLNIVAFPRIASELLS